MFDIPTFVAFLTASMAIVLAPGPAQTLTLARSISGGKKSGIMTALGLNVRTLVAKWFSGNLTLTAWRQRLIGLVLVGLGVRLVLTSRE